MTPTILRHAVLLTVATATSSAWARDKTDTIIVANGDRIHGEIVELRFGQLSFKTDNLGTVHVEWPDVRLIESRHRFYLERAGGIGYFGTLEAAEPGYLSVRSTAGTATHLALSDVVAIDELEDTFWSRINGSLSLGMNYAKSTEISVSSVRFNTEYRARRMLANLKINADMTTDADDTTTERFDLSYNHRFLPPGPNFWYGGRRWSATSSWASTSGFR